MKVPNHGLKPIALSRWASRGRAGVGWAMLTLVTPTSER
jgi:hypothetical protein